MKKTCSVESETVETPNSDREKRIEVSTNSLTCSNEFNQTSQRIWKKQVYLELFNEFVKILIGDDRFRLYTYTTSV